MERVTTKKDLIGLIGNIIAVEKLARDRYINDSRDFSKKKLVNVLKKIKSEEDKHIKMLEDLIDFLEK
jgi:rubrerythrin